MGVITSHDQATVLERLGKKTKTKQGTHECMSICCQIWSILVIYKKKRFKFVKRWQQKLDLPTLHWCPRGQFPMFEEDFECNCPHQNTGWKMDTLYLLVSICRNWQRYVCPCDPLGRRRRKNDWLYNLYEDITSVTFLLLDQTCFKRELWTFYCLKQIATVPKDINGPLKKLWVL